MSMLTPLGVGGRRKLRRRGRSRHVGRTVLVLLVLATAVAAGAAWLGNNHRPGNNDNRTKVAARQQPSCPPTQSPPTVVAAHDVHVNVYNATKKRGLASEIAKQLRKRGFVVSKVENDPADRRVTGIAEVRASAADTAAARTVGAQIPSFVAVPDHRKDASVDLVLGAAFRTLRSPAAASAAMSPTPSPRPSGC